MLEKKPYQGGKTVFTCSVLKMGIVSVLLKLFKCCKRQPTIIFVVLCDYKLVWSNVTSRWIFDFFEIFCQFKRIAIFRGFAFCLKKVRFKTFSLMGRL